MRLLSRSAAPFRSWFLTELGLRFRGVLGPLTDSPAASTTFAQPRHVLHVLPKERITTGTTIFDEMGRTFLLADHDVVGNQRKTFRLFEMTEKVSWKRSTIDTDPVTGLNRAFSEVEMGPIWANKELYGRDIPDPGLQIIFDLSHIITGAPILLDDKVGGKRVSRLIKVYGISLAEVQ